jgi:glycosyltransferase involved in cell wall biosynthesis
MKVGIFPYRPGGNPYQKLFSESLEKAGLDVVRIPPRKYFPLHYAHSHDIDILQLDWPHDWYSGRNPFTQGLKRLIYYSGLKQLKERPCIWTAHNLVAHNASSPEDEHKMINKLIGVCDGIITMSEVSKSHLSSFGNLRKEMPIATIPHGHYMNVYPNNISRRDARSRLEINQEARVVLSLGRIEKYKGLDDLIIQFCRVASVNDVLVIAGFASSATYLNDLNRLAFERCPQGASIRIDGEFIENDLLQVYFNAADVVALPFKNILNSGSLMLAMSFGKCVITPEIGSIPEVVCRDGYFSYDQDNLNSLAAAIADAFSCPDLQERNRKVIQFTRDNYGWEKIGGKVKRLYENVLSR